MKSFTITKNDANRRLDQYVLRICTSLPKSLLQKSLRKGRIKVNKKKAPGDYRLNENDLVEMYINDEFFAPPPGNVALKLVKPDVSIIYEDENILIADKPAGMIVHSDDKEGVNTLINHILAYLMQKGEYDPADTATFTPALCHRIDRNTSGLVITAKNAESLRVMNDIIKKRMIKKLYLCTVVGTPKPESAVIKAYLRRDMKNKQVYVTDMPRKDSAEIRTGYRLIKKRDNLSMLEVELITGRTHQIRAHMAHIGHPLAGDGKYGSNAVNKALGLTHQELCAYKIIFQTGFENTSLGYLTDKEFTSRQKLITFN